MLCRTSTIRHANSGVSMKTPLLIPSFSSRGFAGEIGKILQTASEFLTDVFLISAYDIHHKHLPDPSNLPCKPELIFVDSGGYEISTDTEFSSPAPSPRPEPWTAEKLESVLACWPERLPAVFVSFDHPDFRKPYGDQVEDARKLFRNHRQHLTLLLLKPESKEQSNLNKTIKAAVAEPGELGSFDIVGVTDKELGPSMIDRMCQITTLRLAMDDADVKVPLHVFGGLDPLSICLYYIAGAEIFDGLTWLRYGYKDGVCIYTRNLGILEYGLYERDDFVRTRALTGNYYALQSLQQRLREFEATGKFDKLQPHADLLSDAVDSMRTKFKGRF